MARTKRPVFRGPRKGYVAVFIGEPKASWDFDRLYEHRLRLWPWYDIPEWYTGSGNGKRESYVPCWYYFNKDWRDNYKNLLKFDRSEHRKTIFLGYIKDPIYGQAGR